MSTLPVEPNEGASVEVAGTVLTFQGDNPLEDGWTVKTPGATTVVWSGSLAGDLSTAWPANWMGSGAAALAACIRRNSARIREAGGRLLVRPAARHVLSDPPSTLTFLRDRHDDPVGLALSPAHLFEASMLDDAADHLERIEELLAIAADVLLLADLQPPATDDGLPRLVPLGEGVLPPESIRRLARVFLSQGRPLLLSHPERMREQVAWLADRPP